MINDGGNNIFVAKVQKGQIIDSNAISITTNPTNINGNYGYLSINTNGTYTYYIDYGNSNILSLNISMYSQWSSYSLST